MFAYLYENSKIKLWLYYFLFLLSSLSKPFSTPHGYTQNIQVNSNFSEYVWQSPALWCVQEWMDVKDLLMWSSAEHVVKYLRVISSNPPFTFIFLFQLNFDPSLTLTSCCEIVRHKKTCTCVQRLLPSTVYGKNYIWFLHKMLHYYFHAASCLVWIG